MNHNKDYAQKLVDEARLWGDEALLKFGLHAPSRVKASIQAEGLSPFEGAGRQTTPA